MSLFACSLPLLLGLAVGCLVAVVVLVSVICYFCQGCWVYRRRKRIQHGKSACHQVPSSIGKQWVGWLLAFYVLATSEVIPERVPTLHSAHSLQLYSAVPLGEQDPITMT